MPAQRTIGTFVAHVPEASTVGRTPDTRSILIGRLGLVGRWLARINDRRDLHELAKNRHLLRDIGLEPAQVWREATKPFWRP